MPADLRPLIETSLFLSGKTKQALLRALPTLPDADLIILRDVLSDASQKQTLFLQNILARQPQFLQELKSYAKKTLREAYEKAEASENSEDILNKLLNDGS